MSLNLYQFTPTNMNNIVLPDRTYKYATDKSISTFHPAKTYCMVNDGKGISRKWNSRQERSL